MQEIYNIQGYGSNAILIQFDAAPSQALFIKLSAIKGMLEKAFNCEVILSYQELLLKNLKATSKNIEAVGLYLRENSNDTPPPLSLRRIRIPVCYDRKFGADLDILAKAKNLSTAEVIALHTQPEYLVYFLGFLPGFPYLLGLNEQLHTPRKAVPSREIVAGSVAIGGQQTGIYPQNSPGGWHVIGHCPISIFDATAAQASLFLAGDMIRFEAITLEEHEELSQLSLTEFKQSSYLTHG